MWYVEIMKRVQENKLSSHKFSVQLGLIIDSFNLIMGSED